MHCGTGCQKTVFFDRLLEARTDCHARGATGPGTIVETITGTRSELPEQLYREMLRFRYRVFVEHLGWKLPCGEGLETDQFDRPDTIYVVVRDTHGRLAGCARLLPTTRPYLLEQLFPELLGGSPPPRSPRMWELSRFAAFDHAPRGAPRSGGLSSTTAVGLLESALRCARRLGARRLITVSPTSVERLLRKAGFEFGRFARPTRRERSHLCSYWITTDRSSPCANGKEPSSPFAQRGAVHRPVAAESAITADGASRRP